MVSSDFLDLVLLDRETLAADFSLPKTDFRLLLLIIRVRRSDFEDDDSATGRSFFGSLAALGGDIDGLGAPIGFGKLIAKPISFRTERLAFLVGEAS